MVYPGGVLWWGPVDAALYAASSSHGHRWFSDPRTSITPVELELTSVWTTGFFTRGILAAALVLGREVLPDRGSRKPPKNKFGEHC